MFPLKQYENKKFLPLKARCGPEGSRRFRLQNFHDIRGMKLVRYSASHTGSLNSTNIPGNHFQQGLSRSQRLGAVGRKYVTEKSSVTTGKR